MESSDQEYQLSKRKQFWIQLKMSTFSNDVMSEDLPFWIGTLQMCYLHDRKWANFHIHTALDYTIGNISRFPLLSLMPSTHN